MDHGWHQVAFDRDIAPGLNQLASSRPLMVLRTRKGLRVFDAACPHRAANLGVVGKPDTDAIVCGFHGKRIGLGVPCVAEGYFVREHSVLAVSGLVFVRLGGRDNGLRAALQELDRTYYFVDGYTMTARVAPDLVIENGVDETHFRAVHDIRNEPKFTLLPTFAGEFAVSGSFMMPASPWQQRAGEIGLVNVPYTARIYSSGLIVAHLGGPNPYCVITAATAASDGSTTIRVSVAVRADAEGRPPSEAEVNYLVRQTRSGLSADIVIWESLCGDPVAGGDPGDAIVRSYREFVREMREDGECSR